MREHFEIEVANLRRRLALLAQNTENAVRLAMTAIENQDMEIAKAIIDNDDLIDKEEVVIEEECLKILALYQPVAGDLRYIVTILKIDNELERIADLAVNIAKNTKNFSEMPKSLAKRVEFTDSINLVLTMLKNSIDAFMCRDVALAESVIVMDETLDELHRTNRKMTQKLLQKHSRYALYYVDVLFVSRHLERIGDSCTNICEDVIYLEKGKIVRHNSNVEIGKA